jgi:hypothetical protein
MTSLGNRQPKSTSSKPSTTSTPNTPTNLAPSQKTSTKLRWTSALEGGYCHGVDQMAAPLVLMHAYPSAYAHQFDYVCLHCHLLMHICFCLWFLMFAYDIYACLYMFIYLLMGYDVSEGKVCWNYAVWRKGKWLVGILVLKLDKGICVYKGTCPPAVLCFFLSSSCNVLYYFPPFADNT